MTVFSGQYGPETAQNASGTPLPDARFFVYQTGTTTEVTLYTDRLKTTTVAEPQFTDLEGNMTFWVDPGQYDVVCNGKTLSVVVYADPAEAETTGGAVDGGSAGSLYLPSQVIDGGSASG